jgi:hypothetical protein
MISPHEVALLRLVAQRIAGPRAATAAEAVRQLTATQGQDYRGALVSVALRTRGGTRAGVEAALDAGAERAGEVAVAALRGGRRLGRAALLRTLAEAGVSTEGQRGYHLLAYLGHTGTLCLGPTGDGEQLFVLTDEWIRAPRRLEGDAALRELALRFFASHGPATVADLARWSGLTLTAVRRGLALARDELAETDVDGVRHHLDPATPDLLAGCREEASGVFLLPGFDEFVLGYADRGAVLDAAFADRIVPGGNGMFRATVVSDGRIVGTWRRAGRGAVDAEAFTAFDDDVAAMIPKLAAALPG